MEEQLELITKLVEVAPTVLGPRYRPNHCIAAARHGLEVLRYFGVDAKPQKVQAIASNQAWVDWRAGGGDGDMPEGAWSVGIDLQDHGGGYAGHLVLLVPAGENNLIVDLNCGQMARPERGIVLPPAIVLPLQTGWRKWAHWGADGTHLFLRFLPERDWLHAPDWKRRPPLAGEIIRAIR